MFFIVLGHVEACPHSSQALIRGKSYCKATEVYMCLVDQNIEQDVEMCRNRPEIQRPGRRIVFRGNIDADFCPSNTYQPLPHTGTGNGDCEFVKSQCAEEGQILYDHGNPRRDVLCRCDHSRGYTFVKQPKNICYCLPSEEDCSCYLNNCPQSQVLSQDYTCVWKAMRDNNFECSPVISHLINKNPKHITTKSIDQVEISAKNRRRHGFWKTCLLAKLLMCTCISTIILVVLYLIIGHWKKLKCESFSMSTYNTPSMDFQSYIRPSTAVSTTMSNQVINSPVQNIQTSYPASPTVICPFNCICCLNYQMKKTCYCNAQKTTTGTQTDSGDFLRLQSSESTYFKRGTFAHSLLQRTIVSTNKKYNLKSRKDPDFGRAVMEVLTNFPDIECTTQNHSKLAKRMSKAISWKKFYDKKGKAATTSSDDKENNQNNLTEANMSVSNSDSSDDEIVLSVFKEKKSN